MGVFGSPLCDELWPRKLARNMTVDHIVSVSAGGGDELENLQLVCPVCNAIKNTKSQAEARGACLEARSMTMSEWAWEARRRYSKRPVREGFGESESSEPAS